MLIRHTLLYMPAQLVSPLVQAVTLLIWAFLLPSTELGAASLIISFQEISSSLFFAWWSHFALRNIVRFRKEDSITSFLSSESIVIFILLLTQIVFMTPILIWYFSDLISYTFLLSTLAFISTRSINIYLAERARADARIFIYTIQRALVPAAGLALSVMFVYLFDASAASVLFGFTLSQTMSLVVSVSFSDVFRVKPMLNRDLINNALSFGIPVMASALLTAVAVHAPRFIVDQTIDLAAAGMFAVIYGLGVRTSNIASMLVTAGAYPLVVNKYEAEGSRAAHKQLQQNTILLAACVMPAVFGLIAINQSLVSIILPPDFRESALLILPIAAIAGVIRDFRSHSTNQIFLLHNKTRFSTVISLIDLVVGITFSFIGVQMWGLVGVAAGSLAAAVISLILSIALSGLKFGFFLPTRELFRVTIATLLMFISVWSLPETHTSFYLLGKIVMGAIIYFILILFLLPETARNMRHILRRKRNSAARKSKSSIEKTGE